MKKIIILFLGALIFSSCLRNKDQINFDFKLLPIDEYKVPNSFTFGKKDTINLKYTFPNGCYILNNIYYEYQDTARIVAIKAFVELDKHCVLTTFQNEYNLIVTATQKEDYLFKFWKGKDSNGKDIFEEVVIPVN